MSLKGGSSGCGLAAQAGAHWSALDLHSLNVAGSGGLHLVEVTFESSKESTNMTGMATFHTSKRWNH
jgi:hypothetical protein